MAVGDVKSGISQVNAAEYLTIQPGAGEEWVIHNLYYADQVEMYFTDGANDILFDSDSSAGARLGACFHVNNGRYLKVKNTSSSAKVIGYDGIQTK